jgi:SAM-dependent methyltransferase
MLPWHEDDEFWTAIEPMLLDPAKVEAATGEAVHIARLLGLAPGAPVLDLCCGPGRHSLALARNGFRVTGVDRTPRYLERARRKAGAENLPIEFVHGDMRSFRRDEAFDGAVSLFTSFGYFEDPDEDLRVLRNIRASLRAGGRVVMQMAGKEVLARIFTPRNWVEYPDGAFLLTEVEMVEGWSMGHNRWIYLNGAERKVFDFLVRVYSAQELIAAFRSAGFAAVEVFGDFDGKPYDREAKYLIAVGTK